MEDRLTEIGKEFLFFTFKELLEQGNKTIVLEKMLFYFEKNMLEDEDLVKFETLYNNYSNFDQDSTTE